MVEQVQLSLLTAQTVVLSRVVHPTAGVYLCPREMRVKLVPHVSRQTLTNNINATRGQLSKLLPQIWKEIAMQ